MPINRQTIVKKPPASLDTSGEGGHLGQGKIRQMKLVAPQVLDGGGVGQAPEECGELTDNADITGLRLRCELAHAHVVDHALAQRTDTLAGVSHGAAPFQVRGGVPSTPPSKQSWFPVTFDQS